MSEVARQWARKQSIENVSLKALLNGLADRCDNRGLTKVGQSVLSADLNIGLRQLKRNLATLEALGVIRRQKRSRGARGRATDLTSLAMSETFVISKSDIAKAAAASSRKVTLSPAARCHPPHLAQGDTDVTPNREYISKGGAKPTRSGPIQGEDAGSGSTEKAEASVPVEGLTPTSKLAPHGKAELRPSLGSHYASHRALLDRVARGTIH